MVRVKADMDDNYSKVIKIQYLKRLFRRDNGEWAIETIGGEFGTPSHHGVKRLIRHRPDVIEEPEPYNALMKWLEEVPEENEDESIPFKEIEKP